MYNSYIMKTSIRSSKSNVRTQITLPLELKNEIERTASAQGKSLAEYLRFAALRQLASEKLGKHEREQLADEVVGGLSLKNHPYWKDQETILSWQEDLREEWSE